MMCHHILHMTVLLLSGPSQTVNPASFQAARRRRSPARPRLSAVKKTAAPVDTAPLPFPSQVRLHTPGWMSR